MKIIIMLAFGLISISAIQAQVGSSISADGSAPNNNAILDVQSPATGDGKGMLIPRVTMAQRTTANASLVGGLLDNSGNLRGGAAQGLIVYQTDGTQGLYFNTSQTAAPAWVHLGEGSDLDMQGHIITNSTYYGDGRGITNLSAGAYTETDPRWASASNAIVADIATRLSSNVWSSAGSTTNYLPRTGGTMSGALNMGAQIVTNVAHIDFNGTNVSIGRGANGSDSGAAMGYMANGSFTGAAVGVSANGYNNGVAMGYGARGYDNGAAVGASAYGRASGAALGSLANAYDYGAAMGWSANAYDYGVAVGYRANGSDDGTAVGQFANCYDHGVAVGAYATGTNLGVAVGLLADGAQTNVAIGYRANAQGGTVRIAIGHYVTNQLDNTARIRGHLYLDGGTGLFWRATFGEGSWAAKAFEIDHPLDPENKILRHFCLEGPQVWNVYAGNAQLDEGGEAIIELPAYFEALNTDPQYLLTAVGASMPGLYVKQEIKDNRFVVGGGVQGGRVCWEVKARRNDPACLEDLRRRPVEQMKNKLEIGGKK